MERSLCAGRIPYPPGSRRHERPPYGAGETRRPPGKTQFPRPLQTHVGDDARIVPGCSRRRGVREGHAPPLHAVRARPAKWACRGRPGERRAGCPHPAGPRGGGNVPGFEFQRCGGRERPPYGPGETRRPPGKMQPPRCTVGADSISARFAAAQGSAGGMNPAPTGIFFVSGKPEVRGKAGRADMESAPTWGVCGGGNVPGFEFQRCGGCERPPYGAGETRRPPGKMQFPRPLQTNVGDDARIVPGCSRRHGVCGRGMPLSYMPSGDDRPNGIAAAARANVGRDALIPPHPAAGQGSAGGINPAPTGKFCVPGKPGGHDVCPGLQGRAMALPRGSAAGQAGPI